tara:strand:+ start:5258 stop:5788 length:531 start_codon:yes stop_codon:yes gene_type:complete
MANTDVTSKKVSTIASNNEVGRGYTRQVSLTFQDFLDNEPSGSSDNDTQTYELFTLPVGCILKGVHYHLRTAFDDSGGGSQLQLEIGDTSDPNGILIAKEVHVDSSEVVAAAGIDGAFFTVGSDVGTLNAKAYTAANTVEALFTPGAGGSAYKLSELTQGEIVFVADIIYTNLAQA